MLKLFICIGSHILPRTLGLGDVAIFRDPSARTADE